MLACRMSTAAMRYPGAWSVLAALFITIVPTRVRAQFLAGSVVTADSNLAVAGAIVVLTDGARRELTRTLSRGNGAFSLRAPLAASYGVRVLRIGYRPEDFGPFVVDNSASRPVLLALVGRAVSLAAVHVTGRTECRLVDEGGSEALALWEEARKTLLLTVLTRSTIKPTATVANFERVLDATTHTQRVFHVQQQTSTSAQPYVSQLSPDEYAARGYVDAGPDGTVYRAPDADVLLSESFLARHCVHLVSAPHDTSLIGLAFRPTRSEPGMTDVDGVIWLARAPIELRNVQLSYVGVPEVVRDAGAGASLTVGRLPDGGSIITSWDIRAPRVVKVNGFKASAGSSFGSLRGGSVARDSVADLWIFGGAVMRVRVGADEVWHGPAGRVEGRVSEQESDRPVAAGRILLVGTNYAATADSSGVFSIPDVLPGVYELEARSPQREALGLHVPTTVSLDLGDSTSTVSIRMPPLRYALARACAMSDTLGAVVGRVEDAERRGIADARVVAQWFTTVKIGDDRGIGADGRTLSILSDADGRFRLCGLPRDHNITVTAGRANLVAAHQAVRIEAGEDLAVVTLVARQSERQASVDGLGALDGIVRDDTGSALTQAEVDLVGVAAVRTDSLGRFHFGGLNAGTFLLRARRVGWSAPVTPVSVELGLHTPLEVRMQPVRQLAGITVSASRTGAGQGAFARRAAGGYGTFLNEEQIAARNARTTEALLATLPGVTVSADKLAGFGGVLRVERGFITLAGTLCKGVAVFVDGTDVGESFNLAQISPRDLRSVEFYRGVATTPPEFRTAQTVCGTLVLWLK